MVFTKNNEKEIWIHLIDSRKYLGQQSCQGRECNLDSELHLAPGAPWLCEDSQGRHPRDSAGREGPCRVPSPWCATVVLFYPIKSTHFQEVEVKETLTN